MKNTFAKISPFQVDPEKIMDTFGIRDDDFTAASSQEKESMVTRPAGVVSMAESTQNAESTKGYTFSFCGNDTANGYTCEYPSWAAQASADLFAISKRHDENNNSLFVDGHVESVQYKVLRYNQGKDIWGHKQK